MWIQKWAQFPSNFGLIVFQHKATKLLMRSVFQTRYWLFCEKIHTNLAQERGALQHFKYTAVTDTLQNRKKSRNWMCPVGADFFTPVLQVTAWLVQLTVSTFALYSACEMHSLLQWPPWVFPSCLSPHSHSFNTLYFDVRKKVKVKEVGLHHCFISLHSFHIHPILLFPLLLPCLLTFPLQCWH